MTRRDYIMLSKAIREAVDTGGEVCYRQPRQMALWMSALRTVADIVGDRLAADNPSGFDRQRFIQECGVTR